MRHTEDTERRSSEGSGDRVGGARGAARAGTVSGHERRAMPDGTQQLRERVQTTAAAQGWPLIHYRATVYYAIDRKTRRKTKIAMSTLNTSGRDTNDRVSVGPGRDAWEQFLRQAGPNDLVNANMALSTPSIERDT
jgi:hypothetical protein